MMALEIAIWGAWQVQIFKLHADAQVRRLAANLAGSMFAHRVGRRNFFQQPICRQKFFSGKISRLQPSHRRVGACRRGIRKGIHAVLSLFSAFTDFFMCRQFL